MVSYARSTYEKSRRFHEMLKELQKTISPVMIRTYLAAANKQKDDDVELSLNKIGRASCRERVCRIV